MSVNGTIAPARPQAERRIALRAPLGLVAFGLVVVATPWLARSDAVLTIACQIEIAAIFALSYNILLGETGLFSLGHAAFLGLGGFAAIHWLNFVEATKLPFPLLGTPVAGALGGAFAGLLFGALAARRSGTAFVMITLAFGELVLSSAYIFTGFFGGEEGVSTDRTGATALFGWDFGSQAQVFYLTSAWALIAVAAIFFLKRTPLGLMANATRERAERVAFVGTNPTIIRLLMFVFAAAFAGVAGSLQAINYEIMTVSSLSWTATSMVIVMVYLGGKSHFVGPIVGAALITLAQQTLSSYTDAWLFYLGVAFIGVVLFLPEGLCGFVAQHARFVSTGLLHRLAPPYALAVLAAAPAAAGSVMCVELAWRRLLDVDLGPKIVAHGLAIDTRSPIPWIVAVGLLVFGVALSRLALRNAFARWRALAALIDRGAK